MRRVNSGTEFYRIQYPLSGTAAYAPLVITEETSKQRIGVRKRKRRRSAAADAVFLAFLIVISILTVVMCVNYLQLKQAISAQTKVNASLESRLIKLRNENDAMLEYINNRIDLNRIREIAIQDLGMNYAAEDQIVWYNTDSSAYVVQYLEVPAS